LRSSAELPSGSDSFCAKVSAMLNTRSRAGPGRIVAAVGAVVALPGLPASSAIASSSLAKPTSSWPETNIISA
jgi:hypothetical protein